jgi:hypothetical protein
MRFSARSRFLLLASLAIAVLAFAGSAAAANERSLAAPAPNDALSRALASGRITDAQYSLQRALAILAPRLADARYTSAAAHVSPREATMALRDLAARIGSLSSSDRRLAMRLLARPTDGAREGAAGYVRVPKKNRKRFCTTRFCVHWVTRGSERPLLVDRNRNGKPDYIDKTVRTMNTVWRKEIGSFGYKKPRSDSLSGSHHGGNPNGRIDIFIANIGNRGLYGYCTTDDPRINRNTHRQNSAYCVFDNDFRRSEFTTGAFGLAALKVTAAHEFFHAIQFAYDTFDDSAFMEGTATWMEDEVFTGVNDNVQYLQSGSPMDPVNNASQGPWIPLDTGHPSVQYGTWIWYRFLSENHGRGIVKQIWARAVGKANYGFKAISDILVARTMSLQAMLALFGSWNAAPASFYTEGASSHYPTAGAFPGGALDSGGSATWDFGMFHLSNDYVAVTPGTLAPPTALNLTINFPPGAGAATAVRFGTDGSVTLLPIPLDANGDTPTPFPVAFDATTSKVVVVVTNPGIRFVCNQQTIFSCSGVSLDDWANGFIVTANAS